MKPYFIYFYNVEEQRPSFESGYQGYIEYATSPIDALKKWHRYLNATTGQNNFFRNSTYEAVCALT
jgi:hypothetical protein